MWQQLTDHIRQNVVRRIFHVTLMPQAAPIAPPEPPSGQLKESGPAKETPTPVQARPGGRPSGRAAAGQAVRMGGAATATAANNRPDAAAAANRKVGRNDPCPCGSGKKYKKCHGSGQTI